MADPYRIAAATGQWTIGLRDCCEDPSICVFTCCCPCITFGQNAEIIDKGMTSCAPAGIIYYALAQIGVASCHASGFRTKLRHLYSLQEDPCDDCLAHWCCTSCAARNIESSKTAVWNLP